MKIGFNLDTLLLSQKYGLCDQNHLTVIDFIWNSNNQSAGFFHDEKI